MRHAPKKFTIIAVLFLSSLLSHAVNGDAFERGITAYESKNYSEAIDAFEESNLESENAAANHNLALAYFSTGKPATAAWYLHRAVVQAPFDETYQFKLAALREHLGFIAREPAWYAMAPRIFSTSTWILLTSIVFWIMVAFWALPLLMEKKPNLFVTAGRLFMTLLCVLSLTAAYFQYQNSLQGVMISEESVDLTAAPASAAPKVGIARPGELAKITDEYKNFYHVKTEAAIIGWISKSAFRPLYHSDSSE